MQKNGNAAAMVRCKKGGQEPVHTFPLPGSLP
jgi:hypothetical protein